MGAVYKARDLTLQIDVAVKVLRSKQAPEQTLARFQQEAKTASRLNHPGIVKILDFGVVDGEMPYMVLEYVDGNSLATLIQEKGPLSLEEALPLFIATAETLAHAHGEGVLHRDLKPDNVMVLGQDQIKLLDFGIAKFVENEGSLAVTSTGALVGSPFYMSPEQARGRDPDKIVDCRSDIYSLGVLMFKTLSGQVPIQADSVIETIALKTSQPAPLLSTTGAASNEELDRILARCLAIEPEKRYASVNELLKDLRGLYVEEEALPDLNQASSSPKAPSGSKFPLLLAGVVILFAGGYVIFHLPLAMDSHKPSMRVDKVLAGSEKKRRTASDFLRDEGAGVWTVSEGADSDTFAILAKKPHLKEIGIKSVKIKPAMLAYLKAVPLEQISLEDVGNLSPDILSGIASISSLQRLRFVDCIGFDKRGLEALAVMPNLKRLFLEYCQKIDDQCIPTLSKFPRLNRLSLRMSEITVNGLRSLPRDRIFYELDLAQTQLVDSDLAGLKKLNLRSINLAANKLTEQGVQHFLEDCPGLGEINLRAMNFSLATKLRLSAAFPDIIFHYDSEDYRSGKKL